MGETRDALIRAGIELFSEQGLDAPSLDAICARAGKTRGAFYVHFADRDAFVVAAMERVGLPFLDSVLGAAGEPMLDLATVARQFLASVSSGAYPLVSKGGVKPHQLLDACARSEPVRLRYVALLHESITRLSSTLSRDQGQGAVRADLPAEDAATILLATIVGAQTLLELRVDFDLPAMAAALLRMLAPR